MATTVYREQQGPRSFRLAQVSLDEGEGKHEVTVEIRNVSDHLLGKLQRGEPVLLELTTQAEWDEFQASVKTEPPAVEAPDADPPAPETTETSSTDASPDATGAATEVQP